jgi:hypothetical protein
MLNPPVIYNENSVLLRCYSSYVGCRVWTPVPNVNDPVIQSYGETAVTNYNRLSGMTLRFNTVISAYSFKVYLGTTNFRLTLTAKDRGATNTYEAFVQNTLGKLSLLLFTRITA